MKSETESNARGARADRRAPEFTMRAIEAGRFEIEFSGDFRVGWFGRLCSGLALRGVDVEDGHAKKSDDGHWCGSVRVFSGASAGELESLDWLALSEETDVAPREGRALRFVHYALRRLESGSIELAFRAHDGLGFLSELFRHLGFLGLFPLSIDVRTVLGMAEDSFVLTSLGGAPSESVERALASLLERSLDKPSSPPSSAERLRTRSEAPPAKHRP